jgi:hypothetical protein
MYWAEADILYRKTQRLGFANKKIGLEVNVEETKYMVMPRDQNFYFYLTVCYPKT